MPRKFNKELLDTCALKDSAKIVGEYEKLTQTTRINFICQCSREGNKQFNRATVSGLFCDGCTMEKYRQKLSMAAERKCDSKSYNISILNEYMTRDKATLLEEFPTFKKGDRIKFRCSCGKEDDKTFVRIKISGIYCKTCTKQLTVAKREETNLQKYGNKCALQADSIKEKSKETCIEKYGVEKVLQSEKIKEAIKKTNLEKYGAENPYASKEIIEKIRKTCKEKYGTEFRDYTTPSGEIRRVQGYEPYALDILLKTEKGQNQMFIPIAKLFLESPTSIMINLNITFQIFGLSQKID